MRAPLILVSAQLACSQIVDLTQQTSAFGHFWKRAVGTGHMLLGTRADWQEHLLRAKEDLGFVGVRGHGLLDDDMSVMPRKGQYEFFNVDQVYDYLLEIGVKPVVELSFMPMALVQCAPENCTYAFGNRGGYKGLRMPPKDFDEWRELVQTLAQHFVDRYGLDEVATWDFEVWNELWGMDFPHPYMDLYEYSAKALKAVSPRLRVGGPATMQVLHVADFIDAAQAAGLPIDFVSTHLYPTDPQCPGGKHPLVPGNGDVDCFTRLIHQARDIVRNKTDAEFLITEYNAGLGLKEGLDLDAPFGAAFAFRQIGAIQDVDMFSWWTFTDIFEEGWMRSAPFHNGFGLQTVHGVPKPAWRAFQLLKDAGAWRAVVLGASPAKLNTSLSVLATLNGEDATTASQLQLFVADWSPADATRFSCAPSGEGCVEDPAGGYTDEALCEAQCGSIQGKAMSTKTSITIKHASGGLLSGSDLKATVARIDNTHANPKALWESMGRPGYLNQAQIANLTQASELIEEQIDIEQVDETTSRVSFALPPFSALRIAITSTGAQEFV